MRASWRCRATLLEGCPPPPDEEIVFDALKRASAQVRGSARRGVSVFRAGHRTETPSHYPRDSDTSFDAWCKRVSGRSERSVMLMASGVQAVSRDLWLWATAVLKPLFLQVGLPPYGAEIGIFGGNYESTTLGVHTDAVDVFMFVVKGRKAIRVWEPAVLTPALARKHAFDYSSIASSALHLVPTAGEAAYWPAGHWHIGESSGIALSLNIALGYSGGIPSVPLVGTPRQFLFMASGRMPSRQHLDTPLALGVSSGAVAGLVPGLSMAEKALRVAVTSGRFAEIVLEEQLNRQTAMAFRPPPPKAPRRHKSSGGTLHGGVEAAWSRVGARLVVSAAGQSRIVPYSRALVNKLNSLRLGRAVDLSRSATVQPAARSALASVRRLLLDAGAAVETRGAQAPSSARRRPRHI